MSARARRPAGRPDPPAAYSLRAHCRLGLRARRPSVAQVVIVCSDFRPALRALICDSGPAGQCSCAVRTALAPTIIHGPHSCSVV